MEFNVIKTWSNWDAIHETIVATFTSETDAQVDADKRKAQGFMGTAFIVRPVAAGVSDTWFGPGNRDR